MTEKYNAIWHGYTVNFCTDGLEVELKVNTGCRGWLPVTVVRMFDGGWMVDEQPSIEVLEVNYP